MMMIHVTDFGTITSFAVAAQKVLDLYVSQMNGRKMTFSDEKQDGFGHERYHKLPTNRERKDFSICWPAKKGWLWRQKVAWIFW